MGAQFQSLSLFLLLLLTFQEMMPIEALLCQAPSRFFKGACLSSENCAAICEKDGFISGKCKWFKCVCAKDCTPGGQVPPPSEAPPAEEPSPAEGPPVEDPPPVEGPPAEEPPSAESPSAGAEPPVLSKKILA